ncbi:MAG: LPD1 domain-containing protein, partial [Pseudomonadota bacterium]|nr:LPD1 domain-containing protein [Pseudomonadota bacterium]
FASKAWLLDEPVRSHHLNEPLVLGFQRLFLSRDGQTASPLMKRCIAFDKAQRSYYFSMPEEVAARCFERIVQQQSLKNHFLVAGTLKSKTAELGLYPKQDEANAVAECWLDYFQALGRALEQSH